MISACYFYSLLFDVVICPLGLKRLWGSPLSAVNNRVHIKITVSLPEHLGFSLINYRYFWFSTNFTHNKLQLFLCDQYLLDTIVLKKKKSPQATKTALIWLKRKFTLLNMTTESLSHWVLSTKVKRPACQQTKDWPTFFSLLCELLACPSRTVFPDQAHKVHRHPFWRPSDSSKPSLAVQGTTTLCMVTSRRPVSASSGPASR